ncbi:MAG: hypothetical protein DRJ67_06350 [Thermoprotei archaeon]|nr:MAG: hypothetical protein DRJ67_06350 [Thermoprotei archaeon]
MWRHVVGIGAFIGFFIALIWLMMWVKAVGDASLAIIARNPLSANAIVAVSLYALATICVVVLLVCLAGVVALVVAWASGVARYG